MMSREVLSRAGQSRRAFVAWFAGATAAGAFIAAVVPPSLHAAREHEPRRRQHDVEHPAPRPGITAAAVLPDDEVPQRHKDAYAAAREVPQVLDGIFCYCDCREHRGLYSLLSCFEGKMPQSCGICTGEARLARRLHREGKTLAEIRAAIDRRFG